MCIVQFISHIYKYKYSIIISTYASKYTNAAYKIRIKVYKCIPNNYDPPLTEPVDVLGGVDEVQEYGQGAASGVLEELVAV